MRLTCRKIIFAAMAAVFLSTLSLRAVGFRLPHQDPEGIARGNAFAATADNPAAIYYNPAGIAQLEGQQVRAGIYVISADTKYSSAAGSAHTDTTFQEVPQLYYVYSPTNIPFSFGMGIYAPYGLSLDWGDNTPFNSIAERGSLLYACFNPVVAWRITDTLSIAAGPTINYSKARFEQALFFSPANQFEFKGDGMDFGFNAGLLWQPHPKWSFGLNYRSETKVNYKGTASESLGASSTSSSAEIPFPQFIVGGISYRPTPNWNLEFDLDFTDWSVVKQTTFQNTPFGNIPLTFNYRDSRMYEFGATRQLGNGYFASVGYIYSENSSPDANFNPLIPDMDFHLGSIGVGRHGQHWDWMAAFHFAYGERTVSGSTPSPSLQTADGHYKTFNKAFNVSATYKF